MIKGDSTIINGSGSLPNKENYKITNIKSLTGHHIQPYAMGGKTSIDNCLPLHTKCHFDEFKILHSALFDSNDPIYSAKYFNSLKERLMQEKSGAGPGRPSGTW